METLKKYCSEFIGTFVLVFMGCGSAVFLGCDISGGHLAVALAFGLSIVAMAYAIGNISGCHINPAVSLAMLLRKKLSLSDFFGFIIFQTGGAIAAAGLLKALLSFGLVDQTGGLGSNGVADAGGIWGALLVEVILTFIFIFVILGVTSDEKKGGVAGIVIGLTLTFVHIIGIPLTGTSVNPARSVGPALLAGGAALRDVWVFIVGPFVGSVLAVLAYTFVSVLPKKAADAKKSKKARKH
ncbi:MAG: MIP family channel protein [Oscillospiraceae bacterium]|nr:MIP family channel protein [Oscillospiraceae bacterium]